MKFFPFLLLLGLMYSTIALSAQEVADFPEPESSPFDTLPVDLPQRQETGVHIDWRQPRKIVNFQQVMEMIAWPEGACDMCASKELVYRVLFDEQGKYIKHKVVKGGNPQLHQVVDPCIEEMQVELLIENRKPCKEWEWIYFEIKCN